MSRLAGGTLALPLLLLALLAPSRAAADEDGVELFEKRVRPVLVARCGGCHGGDLEKPKGGLRFDSRESLLKGGSEGPALVPGDPEHSLMAITVGRQDDTIRMPPDKGLEPGDVAAIQEWIRRGAPWPAGASVAAVTTSWAFRPVREPSPPALRAPGWVQTPLDRFVLARLEAAQLTPSPPADRRTLIRRASFDLTGLPPTFDEVEAFVADPAPDAFARVVDRLLASPRYGERWGRHWLDVARYADSKGYVFEEERRFASAYTYRDWVVRALNEDLPYDQFLIQQIAADRLALSKDPRPLAALGFLTLGRRFLNNVHDIVDDRIDVVTRGTLGLTVTCARCHDHKFDPVPQRDYYSLYGVFASSHEPAEGPLLDLAPSGPAYESFKTDLAAREGDLEAWKRLRHTWVTALLRSAPVIERYLQASREPGDAGALGSKLGLSPHMIERWRTFLEKAKGEPAFAGWHALAALPEKDFAARSGEVIAGLGSGSPVHFDRPPGSFKQVVVAYAAWLARSPCAATDVPLAELELVFDGDDQKKLRDLKARIDEVKATHPGAPPRAMALEEDAQPHEPHVFLRGNPDRPGEHVPRRFLSALEPDAKAWPTGGRLELARAIASRENPLTARVFVNRAWLWHTGAPLVKTPSDFGARSEPPANPELLDHLAASFMEHGWSLKALHREILLSAAWQQSSQDDPIKRARDPENALFWRQNRQRLDFESTRDTLLWASGELDATVGGRAVDLESNRRTLYAFVERQNLPATFRAFDFASPDTTSPRRITTTVPQQALYFLSSPFVVERARHLAGLAGAPASVTPDARSYVAALYRRLFSREPDDAEAALAASFLAHPVEVPEAAPWSYGWGEYDAREHRVTAFRALPHFTGSAWQGGAALPDKVLGWCSLHAGGGHPGNDHQHDVVRRWTSPLAGRVLVDCRIAHHQKQGDGIQAFLVSSDAGELGSWTVHDGEAHARVEDVAVAKGTTLDLVVDCRANEGYDSFEWTATIAGPDATGSWESARDFAGPGAPPLTAREECAHVLLESDELVFVD